MLGQVARNTPNEVQAARPQVQAAISRVQESIVALTDELAALVERLSPVLRMPDPTGPESPSKQDVQTVPIAAELISIESKINALGEGVNNIRQRLEV
jgi:hypothetical protein